MVLFIFRLVQDISFEFFGLWETPPSEILVEDWTCACVLCGGLGKICWLNKQGNKHFQKAMEILRKRCDILSAAGWNWRISTAAAAVRTPFWIYCQKVCCCHCWLVSGERKLVEGLLAGILTGIPFSEFVEQQFGNIYRQHVLCSKTADRLHSARDSTTCKI